MTVLVVLHVLAAMIWVGGMFFAYVVLRPAAGPFEAPARLALWLRVFASFFPWVWASIVALLASGYAMLFFYLGGFANAELHIHLMQLTGIVMMLLFFHLYFAPWRRFARAVETEAYEQAGVALGQIRRIVGINLVLGLVTVAMGASGRFWP